MKTEYQPKKGLKMSGAPSGNPSGNPALYYWYYHGTPWTTGAMAVIVACFALTHLRKTSAVSFNFGITTSLVVTGMAMASTGRLDAIGSTELAFDVALGIATFLLMRLEVGVSVPSAIFGVTVTMVVNSMRWSNDVGMAEATAAIGVAAVLSSWCSWNIPSPQTPPLEEKKEKKRKKQADLDTLGVSVYHLEHVFLGQHVLTSMDANDNNNSGGKLLSRDSKIYEIENLQGNPGVIRTASANSICPNSICPNDKKLGAAYVHSIEGEDHVGEATHMLSYTWDYTIGDIVDTLVDFCSQNNLDPKRTYIWICCLCVNQHRVVAKKEAAKSGMIVAEEVDFFSIFGERVKRIGHVLAMMAPWNAPKYITRVWCIFEIYTAHTTKGCSVTIVMPPKQKLLLEKDIIDEGGGINALYEALGNTKVQNADASVQSDRFDILAKVESNVGYAALNNQVNKLLREWIMGVITGLVDSRENTNDEEYVMFCGGIGVIFEENGEHDAAMALFQTAVAICESQLGKEHTGTASIYGTIGNVLSEKGDYGGALVKYQEALDIQLSVLGKNHPDTANTYNNIGIVLKKKGDYEGALAKYQEALDIQLSVLGKDHPGIANSHNNIGKVLSRRGDYDGALAKYQEALDIRLSIYGKDHPDTAGIYYSIGLVLSKKGDYEGALAKYQEALDIQLSVLGKNHPCTAHTYNGIGAVLNEQGDAEGALAKFQKALDIRLSVLGKDHRDTAFIYFNIGSALFNKGDHVGALLEFEKCLSIFLRVLGPDHPQTKLCLIRMARARDIVSPPQAVAHDSFTGSSFSLF